MPLAIVPALEQTGNDSKLTLLSQHILKRTFILMLFLLFPERFYKGRTYFDVIFFLLTNQQALIIRLLTVIKPKTKR